MIAQLDANKFDENELLQIKVALHAPYIQSTSAFERYDGQIEYNGVEYNYVKRRVYNDTLYLYCIPNTEGTRIMRTKNLYARQDSDNTPTKNSEQVIMKKINLANDYNLTSQNFDLNALVILPVFNRTYSISDIHKGFSAELLQPPDELV